MEDEQVEKLQQQWNDAVAGLPAGGDEELQRVGEWFLGEDPSGTRMGEVLRTSLDRIYDGPRTGHFRLSEKHKTEKTHVGTVVEIEVAREYGLDAHDEDPTDYRVAGVFVDCKYSKDEFGWMIPVEAWGHVVLLLWADDAKGLYSGALWRVDPRALGSGKNRDLKRSLPAASRDRLDYLWKHGTLPENTLLHLSDGDLAAIFAPGASGQQRINMLFRLVQRRIVRREVVLTVARQRDGLRRARMARETKHLGKHGIVVLGHYQWDVDVAAALGLPVPRSGEWVSTRVVSTNDTDDRPSFLADGRRWREATEDDPVETAPPIPRSKALSEEGDSAATREAEPAGGDHLWSSTEFDVEVDRARGEQVQTWAEPQAPAERPALLDPPLS